MNLNRVTITGADDSVTPSDLAALSDEFPFVEWGILFSPTRQGSPRYPGRDWVSRLAGLNDARPMKLSAHLCGRYVRDLLAGGSEWFADNYATHDAFARMQVNAGAKYAGPADAAFLSVLRRHASLTDGRCRQYIFQSAGDYSGLLDGVYAVGEGIDAVPLFDCSGGRGVLPDSWPRAGYLDVVPDANGEPVDRPAYHGYAGGLGPMTLAVQLPQIGEAAGEASFWVDIESGVRSDHDHQFDLVLVRKCLELASPFIRTPNAVVA